MADAAGVASSTALQVRASREVSNRALRSIVGMATVLALVVTTLGLTSLPVHASDSYSDEPDAVLPLFDTAPSGPPPEPVEPDETSSVSPLSGDFDWTFVGQCCTTSRNWTTTTTDDIYIRIADTDPCDSISGQTPQIDITLYRNVWWGWADEGTATYSCSQTFRWSDRPAGEYQFYLQLRFPHRDSKTYTIDGRVAYDGRDPW